MGKYDGYYMRNEGENTSMKRAQLEVYDNIGGSDEIQS